MFIYVPILLLYAMMYNSLIDAGTLVLQMARCQRHQDITNTENNQGAHYRYWPEPCFNIKTDFSGIRIPSVKIRWLWSHLKFVMGIPTLVIKDHYIETVTMCHPIDIIQIKFQIQQNSIFIENIDLITIFQWVFEGYQCWYGADFFFMTL